MRHEDLLDIGGSRERAELESRLVSMANQLGFDRMSAFLVTERPGARPLIEIVENTPSGYIEASRDDELASRCPVLQHVKRSYRPIAYDQSTYVSAGAGDLWEIQAPFGYKAGMVVGLHLPEGRHLVVGIDRDQPVPRDELERCQLLSTLQLAAAYVVEPAFKFLSGDLANHFDPPHLTRREQEVLRWTVVGKSTWMVGEIMALSESAVNFHLRNAMRKLECNSKHVAAHRASMLGLISI